MKKSTQSPLNKFLLHFRCVGLDNGIHRKLVCIFRPESYIMILN